MAGVEKSPEVGGVSSRRDFFIKLGLGSVAVGSFGNLLRLALTSDTKKGTPQGLAPELVSDPTKLIDLVGRSQYTQKLNDTFAGIFAQGSWSDDLQKRFVRTTLDSGVGTVIGLHRSKGYYTKVLNIGIAVDGLIQKVSSLLGVTYEFSKGVNRTENSGGFNIFSKDGAAGMYQIVAATAKMLGLKVNEEDKSQDHRLNAFTAAIGGVAYLRHLLHAYGKKENFKNLTDWLFASGYVGLGMIRKASEQVCGNGCSPQEIGEAVLRYQNEPVYHQRYPYYVVGHVAIDYLAKLTSETLQLLDKKVFNTVVAESRSILTVSLTEYLDVCEQYSSHLGSAKAFIVGDNADQLLNLSELKSRTGVELSTASLEKIRVAETERVTAVIEAAKGFIARGLSRIEEIDASHPLKDWLNATLGVQIMVGFLPLSEDRKILNLELKQPKQFAEEVVKNLVTRLLTTAGWAEQLRSGGVQGESSGVPAEVDPGTATHEQSVDLEIIEPEETEDSEEDLNIEVEQ